MTQHDFLALIEEGVRNGRIAPHLADYITGEVRGYVVDLVSDDDQEAQAALTTADRYTLRHQRAD